MRIAILSDIHANLSALQSVLKDIRERAGNDAYILLGDIVNYGMRPNEVIAELEHLDKPILANIWGNHECAMIDDAQLPHFATDRGRSALMYMRNILSAHSMQYIEGMIKDGYVELEIEGKKILLVHGDVRNVFWGKMTDAEQHDECYKKYDFVLHGHSHVPQYNEVYFADENPLMRNKKKTVFINPGSVGQPRNYNPRAQYAILDTKTGECRLLSTEYDIAFEQSLYPAEIDPFYKERLERGV
jgi:putative phosphoesterase